MEVILNGSNDRGDVRACGAGLRVLIFKASGIFNYAQGRHGAVCGDDTGGHPETGRVPFSHLINAIFGTDICMSSGGRFAAADLAIVLTVLVMVALRVGRCNRFVFQASGGPRADHLVHGYHRAWRTSLKVSADLMWGSEIKQAWTSGLPQGINDWIDQLGRLIFSATASSSTILISCRHDYCRDPW